MADLTGLALFSLFAYLLGSVPASYAVAKARGVDVRRVGSGNVGATNVARSVGLPYGALAFLLDGAKGGLAALMSASWLSLWPAGFAVVGHNWSLFLRFKGGKGVATTLGILFFISWQVALVALAVWAAVAGATRYASVASVSALSLSPILLWAWGEPLEATLLLAGLALLSLYQHRENFRRLLGGTEHQVERPRS